MPALYRKLQICGYVTQKCSSENEQNVSLFKKFALISRREGR